MSTRPKVFGIGFQKTGTSSLAAALRTLGYDVTGTISPGRPDIAARALDLAREVSQQHDAFQDNPWPILFREMDELHPGSRFILTLRDTDDWFESVHAHFAGRSTPMREWIYGVGDPDGNREAFVERYERHNREVREYFADRPDDLLVLRITDGEGWEPLCAFLGHQVPEGDFPHRNPADRRLDRRAVRARRRRRRRRRAEDAGPERRDRD